MLVWQRRQRMSEVIDWAHPIWRYSHIVVAFVGLAAFWIPIFAVKGSRLHIRVGKIFTWSAAYVGFTGLISSLWAVADPLSFLGTELGEASQRAVPYIVERTRFFFSILAFLSLAI